MSVNIFERLIGYFSPKAAFNRQVYRMHTDNLRKYEAASHGRRTKGWHTTNASADLENQGALVYLRNRSRDLWRNTSYGKKAMQNLTNNVVGTGIRPKISGELAKFIQPLWKKWGESTLCDYDGRKDFYALMWLIFLAVVRDGECLVILRRVKPKYRGGLPIQLQVLEADHLDHDKDIPVTAAEGKIIQGVEYDKSGRRIGYWIFPNHPGSYWGSAMNSQFYPADEVLHIFEELRPGQTRGVPFGASAMLRLKDLDSFTDFELVKQTAASSFVGFVQSQTGSVVNSNDPEYAKKDNRPQKLTPGQLYYGLPGESITFGNPPVFQGYDVYTSAVLHEIAAGFGTTFEGLTGNLKEVNYSSARIGWNDFQRNVDSWQWNILILQFCQPVFEYFLNAVGMVYPMQVTDPALVTYEWTTPRRIQINPVEDTKADIAAVRAGFKSPQEVINERGYTTEEVIDELKAWNEIVDQNDFVFDTDARKVSIQGQVQPGLLPADQGGVDKPVN